MPVILAPQEAEIRRIRFETSQRKIVHETLSPKKLSRKKKALTEWLKM
jgi:hypothetical protein